jgi:hypothetical protein
MRQKTATLALVAAVAAALTACGGQATGSAAGAGSTAGPSQTLTVGFKPRCPYATDECASPVGLAEPEPGRQTRCIHADKVVTVR